MLLLLAIHACLPRTMQSSKAEQSQKEKISACQRTRHLIPPGLRSRQERSVVEAQAISKLKSIFTAAKRNDLEAFQAERGVQLHPGIAQYENGRWVWQRTGSPFKNNNISHCSFPRPWNSLALSCAVGGNLGVLDKSFSPAPFFIGFRLNFTSPSSSSPHQACSWLIVHQQEFGAYPKLWGWFMQILHLHFFPS